MKRTKSFRSRSIWLNVFEAENGQQIVTINKSLRHSGGWKSTPFFNVEQGDLDDVKGVIKQFKESLEEVVLQ